MDLKNTLIILKKEYMERVAKRSFIIMTLLTPFLILAVLGAVMAITYFSIESDDKQYTIAVVDDSGFVAQNIEGSRKIVYTQVAKADVDSIAAKKSYSAILFVGSDVTSTNTVKMEKFETATMTLESSIRNDIEDVVARKKLEQYNIDNLSEIVNDLDKRIDIETLTINEDGSKVEDSSSVNYFLGYAGGFLIYMFVLIYGSQLLTSVVDEKNSKVVEVMLSTVPPRNMLLGKVVGIGLVALTQIVIWGAVILVGGVVASSIFADQIAANSDMIAAAATSGVPTSEPLPEELAIALGAISDVWGIIKGFLFFMVYFTGGYLIYASLFAAIGSAVSSVQDASHLQTPLTIPIIGSLIFMSLALQNPDLPVVTALSIFPLTSPIIMLARITADIPAWEVISSIVVLYASVWGIIWIAGRIYRIGIMSHGKKPSYKELYKWIKQK